MTLVSTMTKRVLVNNFIFFVYPTQKTSDATRNHLQRKEIVTYFSSCRTNPFHYLVAKDEFDQLGIDLQSLKTTEVCRKGKDGITHLRFSAAFVCCYQKKCISDKLNFWHI